MIIYLGLLLPIGSSDLTRDVAGHHIPSPIRSYSRWGLHSQSSRLDAGELLPHLSTLTFQALDSRNESRSSDLLSLVSSI